jgi:tripartite-type tricarboxylate transporter receptor subunit TctC
MQRTMASQCAALIVLTVLSVCQAAAGAERYDCRNVRWVVPFAPGGGVDVTMRRVAEHLTVELGNVPVVIENHGGGSGALGTLMVRNSQPDGCTILAISSTVSVNQAVRGASSNYDLIKDFEPVIHLVDMPYVIAVYPPTGIKSVADLVAQATKKPSELKCATSGTISYQALSWAAFAESAGILLSPIAYKGGGDQFADVISGRIELMLTNIPQVRPFAQSELLRLVAVTSKSRLESLPGIPTVSETVPGFAATTHYGVLAPKGTSPQKIAALNAAFNRSLKYQKLIDAMKAEDTPIVGGTPEDYGREVAAELGQFKAAAKLIKN